MTSTSNRQAIQFRALSQLSKIIGGTTNSDRAVLESFNALSELLQLKRVMFGTRRPETGQIEIIAALGFGDSAKKNELYQLGSTLIETVIRSGYPEANSTESSRIICVPVRVRSRTIGSLLIEQDKKMEHLPVEEEVNFLRIVASLLGQAVELQNRIGRSLPTGRTDIKGESGNGKTLVGTSLPLRKVLEAIERVGPGDATVLIRGESGTGKELVAHAIHAASARHQASLVKVVCASLPESLLEDALFGHERGAFTGAGERKNGYLEEAAGGTVFLDEIGDVPFTTQIKLLRFLQEKTFERLGGTRPIQVNVRVIAATNHNLEELVRGGRFREDLFYRLNVVPIYLPLLRSRPDDIPLLVDYFVKVLSQSYHKEIVFSDDAIHKLQEYSWPGNVRELENFIERLIVLAPDALITAQDIVLPTIHTGLATSRSTEADRAGLIEPATTVKPLKDAEREQVIQALEEAGGIQQRAARALGITPRQLAYRIKKYDIARRSVSFE